MPGWTARSQRSRHVLTRSEIMSARRPARRSRTQYGFVRPYRRRLRSRLPGQMARRPGSSTKTSSADQDDNIGPSSAFARQLIFENDVSTTEMAKLITQHQETMMPSTLLKRRRLARAHSVRDVDKVDFPNRLHPRVGSRQRDHAIRREKKFGAIPQLAVKPAMDPVSGSHAQAR